LHSTKDTQPDNTTHIQYEERSQPQEVVESGGEDTWKDRDGMETGDEDDGMTPDTSRERTPTYKLLETNKKRDYAHNTQHQMTKDPPISDGDTQLPPPQLSPKRLKKLKTDRDIPTSKDRSRSRNRHKTK
jgi:hypothetical protein